MNNGHHQRKHINRTGERKREREREREERERERERERNKLARQSLLPEVYIKSGFSAKKGNTH